MGEEGEQACEGAFIEGARVIGLVEVGLVVAVEAEEIPPEEIEQHPPFLVAGTTGQATFLGHSTHLHDRL